MFSVLSRKYTIHKGEGTRGMATLKAISTRLKSVKNIQKITKSMKMVSAAKYSRAERELKAARPLGEGTKLFFTNLELEKPPEEEKTSGTQETPKNTLLIAVTSDRGLCGAVHSSVAKMIRNNVKPPSENIKIVCIGDKSRSLLHRLYGNNILFVCQEVGRVPPTFLDASRIANEILRSDFQYDTSKIVFNKFRSVVSYATEALSIYSADTVLNCDKIKIYEDDDDDDDDDTVLSFLEFSMASLIFYTMKEGACSEQSARMTAMDNASKNASEMISKLTLTFNRTRQAVITRELIEIISGASAL